MAITPYQTLPLVGTNPIQYLTEIQTNALVQVFQEWYDKSPQKQKEGYGGGIG